VDSRNDGDDNDYDDDNEYEENDEDEEEDWFIKHLCPIRKSLQSNSFSATKQ
jgi:hypothetical protein